MRLEKFIFLLLVSYTFSASAQKLPSVHFNHVFLTLDSTDIAAIRNSDFIKNEFAGFSTKTTIADSGRKWTGSYMYGVDSYFEIFGPSDVEDSVGFSGIGFSFDLAGDILKLDSVLKKDFTTAIELEHRKIGDTMIPWFHSLNINDSVYFSKSHIYFWVMEYTREYFEYNHFDYRKDTFSRTAYLKRFDDERRNKILKKFTGIIFNVTPQEKIFMSQFLSTCGYTKKDENIFVSPDNFSFEFKLRTAGTRYSIHSLQFDADNTESKTVPVSKNIQVILQGNKGTLVFE